MGDRDLPNLYRAAEVFVYPSLYEGFGLPPLEAMACGCPVLSSPRGSLQEIVGEAAMLVDPEDIAALKEYLLRLALSGSLRKQLRRAGLAHAACFTWAQTSEVYQSIAEKMGRSRAS